METAKLLPVALNVRNKRCLVVGGGPVAARKVQSLVECDARVIVIAPAVCQTFPVSEPHIIHVPRPYEAGDCAGFTLVFACTDNQEVNAAVAREAASLGILHNVVDDAELSDFHAAAAVRRGDICIGITTHGGSPALARYLKEHIQVCVGDEFEQLLAIMSTRRAMVKSGIEQQSSRAAVWNTVLESDVLELLRAGERSSAEALVDELLQSQ
jgi:precorrin-2 dehydrogenase/sirohydrochlorin ferrochelatase